MRLPNSGVIWYRSGPNDAFRKHMASLDANKLSLQPTSKTMIRGKVIIDLKTQYIQIIPPARVTGTRGRSSSPAGNGSASRNPITAPTGSDSPRAKTDEERFQSADAYLSMCPRSEGAESTGKRVVLRTRDLTETMLWHSVLIQASGTLQTPGESFPWGNPVEEARQKAELATREKNDEDRKVEEAKEKGTAADKENQSVAEHTTSSSASSEEGGDSNRRGHRVRKRPQSSTHQGRRNSTAFDDIPLVKARSVCKKRDKKGESPLQDDFILTVDSASSDEGSPNKLLQKKGGAARKSRIISSTTPLGPQRWRYPHESDALHVGSSSLTHLEFLERLWMRTQDRDNELLYKCAERQPLETDFAIAAISNTRATSASAAHLFDQADQRTIVTCKAAMQRNGVPISVLKLCITPTADDDGSDVADQLLPQVAIAYFETLSLRVLLPGDKVLVVPFRSIKSMLPETISNTEAPASSTTPSTEEQSLSATSSGPRGFSSSARLLRRLSPTPSNNSLGGNDGVTKALELTSPMEGRSDSNGSLALVLPADPIDPPECKFLLHIYYLPDAATLTASELYRRGPIHTTLNSVTLGFVCALERKAAMRIIMESHQRCALTEANNDAEDGSCSPTERSRQASPTSNVPKSFPSLSPGASGPSSVFLGAFHNMTVSQLPLSAPSMASVAQYAMNPIVASSDVDVGDERQPLIRATINELVLDCLQHDMVQLYIQSARRVF